MGKTETLKVLADWTESIEKGALPPVPPRPSGIERNIVSTQWDVGDDHSFMHDQISTYKYDPTVNGGGPNYAGERGTRATGDPGSGGQQHVFHRHSDA